MNFIKNMFLIGAAAVAFTAAASETMVLDLRDSGNFDISRQFSVDKDEEPWMWARYTVGSQDYSAPEQYNSSYTDGYYSSAFYTPDLTLEAGTYKIYTMPRKKNSDFATKQAANLTILISQGDMTESAYNRGEMKQIGNITPIPYASTYSESDFLALPVHEIEFTVTTPGKYRIAFFNKGAGITLHGTYIVKTDGSSTVDPGNDPDDPKVDPEDPNVDPDDPNVDPDDPDDPNTDPDPNPGPDVKLETVSLPFSDSFAGAVLDKSKWAVESSGGKGTWEAVSVVLPGQFLGNWSAQDEDGGFASYDGWNGNAGDYARLITAPITKASSTAPVLDFWFRHSHSRGCKNYIKVQVKTDGGDWTDIEGAVVPTYIETLDDGGWVYYKYPLESYIRNCETYQIAFYGVNDGISTYLPVDNVKIYNVADKDLNIGGIYVPETVTAGRDLEVTVTVDNRGAAAISASDYTVSISGNFPNAFEISKVDIPAFTAANVVAKAKVTAEDVLDGPDYNVKATVKVSGNAAGAVESSETKTVTAEFTEFMSPLSPKATEKGSSIALSWGSVKDLDHSLINIMETFNDLQAREQVERPTEDGKTDKVWVDGVKGDFNGFISVDMDKQDGGSYYSTSGSEFQVFKDFMTGSIPQGHSGQYIGLTVPPNIQQNDWLITPELKASKDGLLSLQARIAYIHRESDSYNNTLEVLYATEDYKKTDPTDAFKHKIMQTTSKATSGDLPHDGLFHWLRINDIPAEAKYIALHFITKSALQSGVWIDRIWVSETDRCPLEGYYVYRRGTGRLNSTPLTPQELSYVLAGESGALQGVYYVTALYEQGESEPSDMVGNLTGVASVENGAISIVAFPEGVVISGADGQTASVYSISGSKVASARCDGITRISLPQGIYIVKVGSATAKVLIP